MNKNTGLTGTLLTLLLFAVAGTALGAQEPSFRVMSAPPTPEADYQSESGGTWDLALGYGRVWLKEFDNSALNGVAASLLYKGTIGRYIGFTLSPLNGGVYFGKKLGYSIESYSVGLGMSFGSRLLGESSGYNLVAFGGALYSYVADRDSLLSTDFNSHLAGFSLGIKGQLALTRKLKLIPFYLYMGGGGLYRATTDLGMLGSLESRGSLSYYDAHLFGLDFDIYGVTARMVADLLREDAGTITLSLEIGSLFRAIIK